VVPPVVAVELFRIRLPLTRPFRTARATLTRKDALLVRVVTDDGEGWSEVGAQSSPTYVPETLDSARLALRDEFVPRLFANAPLDEIRGNHAAKAALTGAVLDAHLRCEGRSLASYLGGTTGRVQAGVAVGRYDNVAELLADVSACVTLGYRSIKVKIGPGHDVDVMTAVRGEVGPEIVLQADANGSYTLEHADHLAAFDTLDIACLEQPLAPDALVDHARLAARLQTPIGLDETVTSAGVARDAIELGACTIVSIKTGLVGGLDAARDTHDVCVDAGVGARAGGMVDTGIGRAALLALASLPGFTVTGDLSDSHRFFEHDVTVPFDVDDGTLAVPTGAGLGVVPLPEMLARVTIAHERWRRRD
jgi:O-succinylbenzoate synthase